MSRVFVDTNVFAYQFDHSEPDKQGVAGERLASTEHRIVVSTQVMIELYHVLTRKLRPVVTASLARDALAEIARFAVVAADKDLVLSAIRTAERSQLSIWDAMIVEAAVEAGCEELWTEDLRSGGEIRGVRIVNPFED